jgi:hypothetical protein
MHAGQSVGRRNEKLSKRPRIVIHGRVTHIVRLAEGPPLKLHHRHRAISPSPRLPRPGSLPEGPLPAQIASELCGFGVKPGRSSVGGSWWDRCSRKASKSWS